MIAYGCFKILSLVNFALDLANNENLITSAMEAIAVLLFLFC